MRPLEILLLLVNLLTFFVLALARPHAGRWMRHLAPVALLIAAAQLLLEGPRWQMVPAYLLAGVYFLVWLRPRISPVQGRVEPEPSHRLVPGLAVALAVLALAASSMLPMALPVFQFPPPSGPYGIGTLSYHWVDARRAEIFSPDPKACRELMVQIWYPVTRGRSGRRAPYLADAGAVMAAFARIHDKPAFLFGHFKYVTTNAISSAPVAGDQPSYPVLLFLEGVTGFRQMNTFQVEDLVSHGYIVAAIDQPGAAAAVVFPDGHQAARLTLARAHATVSPSYLPDQEAPRLNGRALKDNSIIPFLAQDVIFTLDQLAALNQTDPNGILSGRLDMRHAGAFGVSLGGIVVGEAYREPVTSYGCRGCSTATLSTFRTGLRSPPRSV